MIAGLVPGHSTYMALIGMQDQISNAIEKNSYSKASDTVNHAVAQKQLIIYREALNSIGLSATYE